MNGTLHRRHFLKQAGAVGLGLGLAGTFGSLAQAADALTGSSGPTPTPGADKLGWKLAVHSYTFRKFNIFDAIDMTAALGIRHMSISGSVNLVGTTAMPTTALTPKDQQRILDKMKANGIEPKFVNIGVVQLPPDEAKSRAVFEFAKTFNLDTLVSEPPTASLDLVEKLCEEYKIRVAIHEHPKGHSIYWHPDMVLAAIKGRSPLMGACADVGHWMRSFLDPVECLKKLEGHVFALHFKDLNKQGPDAHDVPWGTGASNVHAQMVEMKRQGFKGSFCVEYEYNWDHSSTEIAQCAKFFNATCDELAAS